MTTCQICGRAIKANTGLIAHHGYRRPYPQLQTRSCFGARRLPYEVAHDAIDEYLLLLKRWLLDVKFARTTLVMSPPDQLQYRHKRDAWDQGTMIDVSRPDNFDPNNLGPLLPRSYAALFINARSNQDRNIANLIADHRDLTARRAA